MRPTTPNILAVLDRATETEVINGRNWYLEAHAFACVLDGTRDGRVGAGVIAALSPITPWDRNVVLARRAFDEGRLTGGTLGNSVRAANRILDGEEPLEVLQGLKVRNFFGSIVNPSCTKSVCIDRHAFDVAVGRITDDRSRGTLKRVAVYESFARAYSRAAVASGLSAATVQAVTWVTWRREKGLH